jgi:uncharacterized protein involved in response to NO
MRRRQGLAGIPVLSFGFRPFFLGGTLWAGCAMPLWIGLLAGRFGFAASYGAVAWHAHEFLFGYVAAIVAGFILTAIPNWTGRLPVRGGPLLALFGLWAAGRIALLAVGMIGFVPAVVIDSLFLPALAAVILREIIAGRDRRNVKVALLITLLAAANILFHVEVYVAGMADYGLRAATAAIIGLIMLVGGRVTPSFTHNWLAKRKSNRRPAPFGRYDVVTLFAGAGALILWLALPNAVATGVALLLAGSLHAYRLSRWAGAATWREPLVLILHVGYGFVPLGFICVGIAVLWPSLFPPGAALHAWTAGAMGVMTLAVMTRATLSHSGRDPTLTTAMQAIYALAVLAALARIAAPFFGDLSMAVLVASGTAWTAAFLGFVVIYGPMLLKGRRSAA